jgi:hypothetical protein
MKTVKVENLSTDAVEVFHNCTATEAVIKAWEKNETGERPKVEYGRCSVLCGDWCALAVEDIPDDVTGLLDREPGAAEHLEREYEERTELPDDPDIYAGDMAPELGDI